MQSSTKETSSLLFVDFAHHELCTINCRTPSFKGFEVTNLISDSEELRQKGFLARSSASVAIITLQFLCPVDISHIVVNTSSKIPKTTIVQLLVGNGEYQKPEFGVWSFKVLSYGCIKPKNRPVAYFINPNYNHLTGKLQEPQDVVYYNIAPYKNNVQLQLKLIRARHGDILELCRIEVWGSPSSIPQDLVLEKILSVWANQAREKKKGISEELGEGKKNDEYYATVAKNVSNIPEYVPSDFMDIMSCDFMTMPILLPSGRNIDLQTLVKHLESESRCSKVPSDPFTDLPFSIDYMTHFNVSLKIKIDAFLKQHLDVAESIGFFKEHRLDTSEDSTLMELVKSRNVTTQLLSSSGPSDSKDRLHLLPMKELTSVEDSSDVLLNAEMTRLCPSISHEENTLKMDTLSCKSRSLLSHSPAVYCAIHESSKQELPRSISGSGKVTVRVPPFSETRSCASQVCPLGINDLSCMGHTADRSLEASKLPNHNNKFTPSNTEKLMTLTGFDPKENTVTVTNSSGITEHEQLKNAKSHDKLDGYSHIVSASDIVATVTSSTVTQLESARFGDVPRIRRCAAKFDLSGNEMY